MTANCAYDDQITTWLRTEFGTAVSVSVARVDNGRVNDTRIATVNTDAGEQKLVVKRALADGAVYRPDPDTEIRFLRVLHAAGIDVPHVRFTDDGAAMGQPSFAMDYLQGRAVADDVLTGYLADGWFQDATPADQCKVWRSFHDALAAVHRLPAPDVASDPLWYWRRALSDVADRAKAAIQHEVLDWLSDRRPDEPAQLSICMGDARLANALFDADRVWLVDWELAHIGHAAADIAYSLHMNEFFSRNAGFTAPGIPTSEQTWQGWEDRSGRRTDDRDYWAVHAGMVIAITATRAMSAMMRTPANPTACPTEDINPFAQELHDLVSEADR